VQSFHDSELKTLGRIHSSDEAVRSIETIKKSGVKNVSIDLMYGIPGQTMDSWRDSLSKAIALSPTHLSAYELTPEKGTPLYGSLESGKMLMPDEDSVLEMYHHTIDYLTGIGYDHYEISNFALPGFICIHNLNYWDRGAYLGAGTGAHSLMNGVRSQNSNDIKGYIENLDKGIIPDSTSSRLTSEEAVKESIFLGLRKREGINLNKIPHIGNPPPVSEGDTERHPFPITKETLLTAGKELIAEGYLELSGDSVRLTREGRVISNTIIVMLFEKLGL
jgi:oxygen-independent coproporphyrinogen-3 oxidase